MQLDLDPILESSPEPWDFSIVIRGTAYKTRPPTLEDLAVIEAANSSDNKSLRVFAVIASILGCRTAPEITLPEAMTALRATIAYGNASAEKNAPGIAKALSDQLAEAMPSPGSTKTKSGSSTRQSA